MRLLARFPTFTAWVVAVALIGIGTFLALQGLRALQPSAPPHLEHIHGVIVATREGDQFAVQTPGHTKPVWFIVAPGAHVSFAHVLRHMHEHAPTDVYYQTQSHGLPLAWIAD
ncbi:MAG: hypothetical protein ACLQUY_17900 [Ktedonobacterales bacterium]